MDEMKQRYEQKLAKDTEVFRSRIDVTFERNPFRSLAQRFVIAASPRTGSTLLCELLLAHGAVVAESLLPVHVVKACHERGDISLGAYCEQYLKRNAPDGVFGTKGWPPLLVPLILCGEFPEHLGDWKFVHLTRVDLLKQAISKVIAAETLAWQSRNLPSKTVSEDNFDAGKISRALRSSEQELQEWNDFFDLYSIQPLRITYEALAEDPAAVGAQVADYLDLHGPPLENKRSSVPLEVQATSLNTKWEERFLRLGANPRVRSSKGETELNVVGKTRADARVAELSEIDRPKRAERIERLELEAREYEAKARIIEGRVRLAALQERQSQKAST